MSPKKTAPVSEAQLSSKCSLQNHAQNLLDLREQAALFSESELDLTWTSPGGWSSFSSFCFTAVRRSWLKVVHRSCWSRSQGPQRGFTNGQCGAGGWGRRDVLLLDVLRLMVSDGELSVCRRPALPLPGSIRSLQSCSQPSHQHPEARAGALGGLRVHHPALLL